MSKKLNEAQNFMLGTIAAFVESVILQPTLYWKNAKAQKLPFTIDPRIIYRGTSASIFNECQMMALQFSITRFFQQVFHDKHETNASIYDYLDKRIDGIQRNNRQVLRDDIYSSILGGGITALATSPIELIMIQQQLHGGSFIAVLHRIIATKGLIHRNGLMRGLIGTSCRDAIYVTGMLTMTPILQDHFIKYYDQSRQLAGLYSSIISGITATVMSQPFDVVKTCMQGDIHGDRFTTFSKSFSQLMRERGLFRGLVWRSVNIVGTIYVANELVTYLPKILFGVQD